MLYLDHNVVGNEQQSVAGGGRLTGEGTEEVVDCDPLKGAFLLAGQNTGAGRRQVVERVDG